MYTYMLATKEKLCIPTYKFLHTYIHTYLTMRGMRFSNSRALFISHRSHQVPAIFDIITASSAWCPSSPTRSRSSSVDASGREVRVPSTITMSGSHCAASVAMEDDDASVNFVVDTITMNGAVNVNRTHLASPAKSKFKIFENNLCMYVCLYVSWLWHTPVAIRPQ